MSRIVFLDIDGVLNDAEFLSSRRGARPIDDINPVNVARLSRLLAQAGAEAVLSSSWREHYSVEEVTSFLRHHGFTGELLGATPSWWRTPDGTLAVRGDEIQGWLDGWPDGDRPHVESFVILDDNDDMVHLSQRLVQTSFDNGGLLDEHVERAVALLTEGKVIARVRGREG